MASEQAMSQSNWQSDIGDHAERANHTDIHGVDEVKQWLIQFWCNPVQDVIITARRKKRQTFICSCKKNCYLSTPYEFTYSDRIRVVSEWLACKKFSVFFCKNARNVYLLHKFCWVERQRDWGEVEYFICADERTVKISQQKPKISQE